MGRQGDRRGTGATDATTREPDEALLAGFLKGDQVMFHELVKRYEQPLYAFIWRYTGQSPDAADIFQETFVRAYQRAGSFGARGSFKAWLYTIAANLCRDQGRREKRHRNVPLAERPEPDSGRPGPNGRAASKEIGEEIASAVASLPPQQREVFVLRAYDEMSYRQIGDALDRPLGTVKSQMRLALQKLRGQLRDIAELYGYS